MRRRTPRRLVHLPEDEHGLVDDARLLHLVPQVVALAGALAHAGEDGEAAVLGGDVADELLDDDGLAHAGAAVGPDLAALGERRNEVEHLDAGLEDLRFGDLVVERRRGPVDGPSLLGHDVAEVIQGLAGDVEEAAERGTAHGDGDSLAGVHGFGAATEALGGAEREASHPVVPDVLLDFEDELLAVLADFERIVDSGQLRRGELDVHHGANDLHHLTGCHLEPPAQGEPSRKATLVLVSRNLILPAPRRRRLCREVRR